MFLSYGAYFQKSITQNATLTCARYWWALKLTFFFSHRTEFKAYRDVKPARMIRAKSQYLPPDEKTSLETSYSATFKGQAPLQPADNKALERRRIRSLYSEPYIDPTKQVRTDFSNCSML